MGKKFLIPILITCLFSFVIILGCGEETTTKTSETSLDDDDSAIGDDDAVSDDDDNDSDDDDDNGDDDDDDNGDDDDSALTAECESADDCGGGNKVCLEGVCVAKPDREGVTKYGKIDNSCLGAKNPPAGTESAILEGCVDAFGLDQSTVGLTVEIYKLGQGGKLGDLLDTAVSESIEVDKCGNHSYYTTKEKIPLDTQLVFKVSDPNGGFVDTYQYNQFIPSEDAQDGKVTLDKSSTTANVIANSTYSLIPVLAGIGAIDEGKGAIAGEVHDCLDAEVENATVGMSPLPDVLVYFEGTDPDPAATSTDPDATYAGANTVPGSYKVVAAALKNGAVQTVGAWNVQGFPDSVTIITFDMHQQPY
ncbi:MAG: hypothetical protein Kow0090_09430 [Myxococcota bacterium]